MAKNLFEGKEVVKFTKQDLGVFAYKKGYRIKSIEQYYFKNGTILEQTILHGNDKKDYEVIKKEYKNGDNNA